jgi:hypothetical protein
MFLPAGPVSYFFSIFMRLFGHCIFFEGSRRLILLVPDRSGREKSAWTLAMPKRWFRRACLRRKYNGRIVARKEKFGQ